MSELDLDALEKLNAERTRESETDNTPLICECGNKEDARFIAAIANSFPALLRLARRAADAERERDEARDDYLRRHKDACDRYEEIEALKSRLAALKEKCAPFVRALEEGDNVPGQSKADNRSSFQMVRVSDLRELARAVNGEEKQEAGE